MQLHCAYNGFLTCCVGVSRVCSCHHCLLYLPCHQVTEELLASFFEECGTVNDCRICGDPNSAMRFSFIEFADEESARRVGYS